MQRGEIWWANLFDPAGSGPGYRRPVLIVQSNLFNASAINTLIVAVITSNLKLADAPGNLFLPSSVTQLPSDSVLNVSQIITLDKQFLSSRVVRLPSEFMALVNQILRLVLSL